MTPVSIGAIAAKGLRYRLDFWQGTGAFRNLAFQKTMRAGFGRSTPKCPAAGRSICCGSASASLPATLAVETHQRHRCDFFVNNRLHFWSATHMSTAALSDVLPKAVDCKKRVAEIEGEKASEHMRLEAAKSAEKKALLDQFLKPSGVSDEETMKSAGALNQPAGESGQSQVEGGRFTVHLC